MQADYGIITTAYIIAIRIFSLIVHKTLIYYKMAVILIVLFVRKSTGSELDVLLVFCVHNKKTKIIYVQKLVL